MGLDASIICKNKKNGVYVDRKYNVCNDANDFLFDVGFENKGILAKEAILLVEKAQNSDMLNKNSIYWNNLAIGYLKSLKETDIVWLIDDNNDFNYSSYKIIGI